MPQPVLVIAGFKCFGNLSEGPKMLLCFATDQQTPQLEKKKKMKIWQIAVLLANFLQIVFKIIVNKMSFNFLF